MQKMPDNINSIKEIGSKEKNLENIKEGFYPCIFKSKFWQRDFFFTALRYIVIINTNEHRIS